MVVISLSDGRAQLLAQNKAPKKVLDRAIAFAEFHNIHLIWIDQECIDQDDRTVKECGIQSMDLVYEQASHAVALLTTPIKSRLIWTPSSRQFTTSLFTTWRKP
jgi:hypothetical protein